MPATVVFIHTIEGLDDSFNALVEQHAPGVRPVHIADGTLIRSILRHNGLTPALRRRVLEHVFAAADFGAAAVQFTCSTISPLTETASDLCGLPVLKIDAPMFREALQRARAVGLIATNPTTLAPSSRLLEQIAAADAGDHDIADVLCEGAYDALLAGDTARHDRIVSAHLQELARRVDAICLAQASMARVADGLTLDVPILSSPEPAVRQLAGIVAEAS